MKLMTEELKRKMPELYAQEHEPDPVVYARYFCITNNWTWYATEFDGEDIFFGYVKGDFPELGYFSLKEFEEVNRNHIIPVIERDLYFTETRLNKILETK